MLTHLFFFPFSPKDMSKLTIPTPIRLIFNTFPLVTYEPVQRTDIALQREIQKRSYILNSKDGSQTATDGSGQFFLLVDKVFREKCTDADSSDSGEYYLPADPISLFVLFSLCLKNSLLLPRSVDDGSPNEEALSGHAMVTVEREELPSMLIDNELVNRSTLLDKLNSERFTAAELMLAHLLDKDLYPLFESNVPKEHKLIKLNRDLYSQNLLLEKASITLTQFEKLVEEKPPSPRDYLSLKIASYVMAILHSEQCQLKKLIMEHCPALLQLSYDVKVSLLQKD